MSRLTTHSVSTGLKRPSAWLVGIAILLTAGAAAEEAYAQRPFAVIDPFYRSETARRIFYDGIAVTGEIAYSSEPAPGTFSDGTNSLATTLSPLRFSVRLHYELAPRIDLNVFWDALGGSAGRTVVMSWVGLKYYWTVDNFDYAFRLAVDPSSDGRLGFPQLDLAFISTRAYSPLFTSDFAAGVRRVRKGFRQFIPATASRTETNGAVEREPSEFIDTRAIGMELHFMWTHNMIFDPASSNVFVSLLGEAGQYSLFEQPVESDVEQGEIAGEDTLAGSSDYRGGVLWVRSGMEYNRPSYQVIPFVGIPVTQWAPEKSDRARLQFGLRLMLR